MPDRCTDLRKRFPDDEFAISGLTQEELNGPLTGPGYAAKTCACDRTDTHGPDHTRTDDGE